MSTTTLHSPHPLSGELAHWRDVLSGHYQRLSAPSRRLRFLCGASNDGLNKIAQTATPDGVIGIHLEGEIRGVVEIFITEDQHAEIGVSVEDAYQGQGYGKQLIIAGLTEAERLGVKTADIIFDPANQSIKHIVHSSGSQVMSTHGSELRAMVDVARAISTFKSSSKTN